MPLPSLQRERARERKRDATATAAAAGGERESWRLDRCGRETLRPLQKESKRELEREKKIEERETLNIIILLQQK